MSKQIGVRSEGSGVKPNRLDSLVFKALIGTDRVRNQRFVRRAWQHLYARFERRHRAVEIMVHGRDVVANFGYTYPLNARRFPNLNAPLVELVHQCFSCLGRPVTFVDVGAAIGDTVLLVESNCPQMVERYTCVDGDREFMSYLRHNLGFLGERVEFIEAQLSRSGGPSAGLSRIHPGTASAQAGTKVATSALDDVLARTRTRPVDVIKVDVDGFDGQVLTGARNMLAEDRPAVIFEWHPILCRDTENDWQEAFSSLVSAGYANFVFFTKLGFFSHFMCGHDRKVIDRLAEYCLGDVAADMHYDVVALPPDCPVCLHSIAQLRFAAGARSRW